MAAPKLNLVDAVLVVGADSSTGLELHPHSERKQRHLNSREENTSERSASVQIPPRVHWDTDTPQQLDESFDENDLLLELTDPEAEYRAQVKQRVLTILLQCCLIVADGRSTQRACPWQRVE